MGWWLSGQAHFIANARGQGFKPVEKQMFFCTKLKYAPGGFTLEMGELAKSGYAAFVAALPQVYMKCSFTAGASKADTSHLQSGMLKK